MRPLGGRLDESEMLGSTPYTYYGGKGLQRCFSPSRPHGEGSGPIPELLAVQGLPPSLLFTQDSKGHTLTDTYQHTLTHRNFRDAKSDSWVHSPIQ